MPPKKQPKGKFRRGARGKVDRVKKGKKKASQKQIVNVTVTSTGSGSGGSSMGVPSQPIFMPNSYQQPIFTPAVDPIKNTLTEVLKKPIIKKVSQGSQIDAADEIPPSTPAKSIGNWGFDDVYGSNPMMNRKKTQQTPVDDEYQSAPEYASPLRAMPIARPRGKPIDTTRKPHETDAQYVKRMETNSMARERRAMGKEDKPK